MAERSEEYLNDLAATPGIFGERTGVDIANEIRAKQNLAEAQESGDVDDDVGVADAPGLAEEEANPLAGHTPAAGPEVVEEANDVKADEENADVDTSVDAAASKAEEDSSSTSSRKKR